MNNGCCSFYCKKLSLQFSKKGLQSHPSSDEFHFQSEFLPTRKSQSLGRVTVEMNCWLAQPGSSLVIKGLSFLHSVMRSHTVALTDKQNNRWRHAESNNRDLLCSLQQRQPSSYAECFTGIPASFLNKFLESWEEWGVRLTLSILVYPYCMAQKCH